MPRLSLAPDVVLRVIEGDALLLKLGRESVFSLNATGARVAQLLVEGRTARELVTQLAREYGAGPDDVERDVLSLVRDLKARGLVVETPGAE